MTTSNQLLKYSSFGLTGVLILALITATILEKTQDTTFVIRYIYGSPLFILSWGVVAVTSFIYLLKRKATKQAITFCLHLSFILILAGALTTHLSGIQGAVHLRQDASPVTTFIVPDGDIPSFPFQVSVE